MKKTFITFVMLIMVEGLFAQATTERVPGVADVKLKMNKTTAFSIIQSKGWTIEPITLNLKVKNFERFAVKGFTLGSKPFEYLIDFHKDSLVRIYVVYISDNLYSMEVTTMFSEFYLGLRTRLTSLYGKPSSESMNIKAPYTEQSLFVDSFIAGCSRPTTVWKPNGYSISMEMRVVNAIIFILGVEYTVSNYTDILNSATEGAFDAL